jgi:hypothetical protein
VGREAKRRVKKQVKEKDEGRYEGITEQGGKKGK